ncbi:hypothetical protein D3C81_592860 [compost metagenome]
MVKPAPEGLSIRPCVWPVGSRAYPRSGVGLFVRTKYKVLGQDSRFASMLHRLYLADVLHDGSEKDRIVFLLGGFEVGRNVCAVRQVLYNMVLAEFLFFHRHQIRFLTHQYRFMRLL